MPLISVIVAMDEDRGIGKNNKIPWRLPNDLKRFKERTIGDVVVMGRKTYESIGRPLPGRTNIVLTRDPTYRVHGVLLALSMEAALLHSAAHNRPVWICGGENVYEHGLRYAHALEVTWVEGHYDCDRHFPRVPVGLWERSWSGESIVSEGAPNSRYCVYTRTNAPPLPVFTE